ncbi:hypothetical protein CCHOA_03295 [Corynebacterium choanae]|uniref:Uncharacterized protein n=1 Tax=Corynebacterium choanae TaxID=1862358 RepID=A0A3G6J4Q6_9CORY|nr:hypothetical protein CCHOA_03295 [Corynebacterium choanae]
MALISVFSRRIQPKSPTGEGDIQHSAVLARGAPLCLHQVLRTATLADNPLEITTHPAEQPGCVVALFGNELVPHLPDCQ